MFVTRKVYPKSYCPQVVMGERIGQFIVKSTIKSRNIHCLHSILYTVLRAIQIICLVG